MSTNNFINDKNGIFILPVDNTEPQLDFDIEVQDWFSNLDYLLEKKDWSLDWDYGNDIAGEKKFTMIKD